MSQFWQVGFTYYLRLIENLPYFKSGYKFAKCCYNNGPVLIGPKTCFTLKKSIALSFWLSHPKLHWLMWKVCAEPTTSAGVGLWKCNSHEERPNSPVTPNPPAAGPPLCLIPLFSPVHHLRMLSCEHCRRRQGQEVGEVSWWREGSQRLGWQSKHLGLDRIKEVNQTGSNCKTLLELNKAPSNLFLSVC